MDTPNWDPNQALTPGSMEVLDADHARKVALGEETFASLPRTPPAESSPSPLPLLRQGPARAIIMDSLNRNGQTFIPGSTVPLEELFPQTLTPDLPTPAPSTPAPPTPAPSTPVMPVMRQKSHQTDQFAILDDGDVQVKGLPYHPEGQQVRQSAYSIVSKKPPNGTAPPRISSITETVMQIPPNKRKREDAIVAPEVQPRQVTFTGSTFCCNEGEAYEMPSRRHLEFPTGKGKHSWQHEIWLDVKLEHGPAILLAPSYGSIGTITYKPRKRAVRGADGEPIKFKRL